MVLLERHDRIDEAIAREKALKTWQRQWKLDLIDRTNPGWRDLWEDIGA